MLYLELFSVLHPDPDPDTRYMRVQIDDKPYGLRKYKYENETQRCLELWVILKVNVYRSFANEIRRFCCIQSEVLDFSISEDYEDLSH